MFLVIVSSIIFSSNVMGKKDNPWDSIWNAISDIQNRLTNVESTPNYEQYIRILETTEYSVGYHEEKTITSFTVTPSNPSNNIILDYFFYFETSIDPVDSSAWSMPSIIIYDENGVFTDSIGPIAIGPAHTQTGYFWSEIIYADRLNDLPIPNQSSYTFELTWFGNGGSVKFRNFNLVIKILDGLPPTV